MVTHFGMSAIVTQDIDSTVMENGDVMVSFLLTDLECGCVNISVIVL